MENDNIKIKYWIELWENLVTTFLEKSYGLTPYSPHILIDDIISEIEENSFRNTDNKKFFYLKIDDYSKSDVVLKEELPSQIKILRRIFNTERTNYILEISKDIKEKFQSGLYFRGCLGKLTMLLLSEDDITKEWISSMEYYSQGIIVEMLKKTYSLEDIKKFPSSIFDNYQVYEDDHLVTSYPHNIDSEQYLNEVSVFDKKKYNNDVIQLITDLTNKDRIERLSFYYFKEKEKVHYIFMVEGLKGDIDVSLGDVNFYAFKSKKFVDDKFGITFEDMQQNVDENKFVQAAVEVDYLMPKSSLSIALTKLENALDFLSCRYNTKTAFYYNASNYIIVKNRNMLSSSMGRDENDKLLKFHKSLDLSIIGNNKKIDSYSFLWNESSIRNKSVKKINNALHWYRKAEHSSKPEDKLLNYWISIENLFNLDSDIKNDILNDSKGSKFHLIQETIASIQLLFFVYDFGWDLFSHYHNIAESPIFRKKQIPQDLIEKANLKVKAGEGFYLEKFVNSLNDFLNYEDNVLFIERINNLIEFYNDYPKGKKLIEKKMQETKDDVLMIYRLRNLVVHNAHFDNTLLPYFVWKIKEFSSALINTILTDYSTDKSLSDILLSIHLKRERLLCDFEDGKVNLFNN